MDSRFDCPSPAALSATKRGSAASLVSKPAGPSCRTLAPIASTRSRRDGRILTWVFIEPRPTSTANRWLGAAAAGAFRPSRQSSPSSWSPQGFRSSSACIHGLRRRHRNKGMKWAFADSHYARNSRGGGALICWHLMDTRSIEKALLGGYH